MSPRQQDRLLRTVAATEWVLFLLTIAAVGWVIVRIRLDAFGVLAALGVIALFLLKRFERRIRAERLADEGGAA